MLKNYKDLTRRDLTRDFHSNFRALSNKYVCNMFLFDRVDEIENRIAIYDRQKVKHFIENSTCNTNNKKRKTVYFMNFYEMLIRRRAAA